MGRELAIAAGMLPDLVDQPATAVRVAAAAGFRALGLRTLGGPLPRLQHRALADALDTSGLRLLDLEVALLRPDGDEAFSCERVVAAAHQLGPRHLVALSMCTDAGRTTAWLDELCGRLAGTAVRVVLEPAPFSGVPTLVDAAAVVAATGRGDDELAVVVDNLHVARAGRSPAELEGVTSERLPMAQVCDAPATAPTTDQGLLDEATGGRLLPGAGALPVTAFLAALPDATAVSVEVLSDELTAATTPAERAELAFAATMAALPTTTTPPTREHAR